MANLKITKLPTITEANATAVIPIVQNGVTGQISASNLTLGELKTFRPSKFAINKDEAEYILDVGNSEEKEFPLTGTVSFDGMMFNGIGTKFDTEYENGFFLKVISTGELYGFEPMGDTEAFADSPYGPNFSNEACLFIGQNQKYLNILEVLKLYNENGYTIKENNEFYKYENQYSIFRSNRVRNGTDFYNIEDKVQIQEGKSYQKAFRAPFGNASIKFKKVNGISEFSVSSNNRSVSLDGNGIIKFIGLPTVSQGVGTLYVENGFLKIG